jgi:ornithine carbamoyltransferase
VYNGLTDIDHPTQVLADLMTLEEEFGALAGKKMVFVGDGRNNVARALMIGCAKMGVHFSILTPKSLYPDAAILASCEGFAKNSGAKILATDEIGKELLGADAIYTDVWASMGEEAQLAERMKILRPYQVTRELMEKTGRKDTIFLHCLPAVKGNEVTAEVIDGPSSRAWDEAENRKHTIKALMLATL